jgi:ankyrin repeat protein
LTDKPLRFLLASLHVDSLVSKKTTTKLKSALENLSHGSGALGDAYNKAIDRIDGQEHDNCTLAKQVLSWISYARRPLTTQELCHALAVEIGDEDFDSENVTDVEDILSVCAGLVTVDEESQIIRLVHYTTQEYLEGIREDWHPKAQQEIASTCLTYLCFEPFRSAPCPDFDKFESRRKAYSFLDYSARYWRDHVSAVQEDICELAMALLQDSNLVSYAYLHECEGHYEPLRGMTGLHLTASFGLLHLFKELLSWAKEENMDLANSQDTWGATPLFCAVENGHEEIVTLLLGNEKVDVNVQDEHGRTSLIMAIQTERKDIAELLLNTGKVDVDSNIGDWMPLSSAVACGQKEIVELLLCTGKVDVNEKCSGWTPLFLAVRKGHKEIVELLLGLEKADVNKTPNRMALLRYAVEKGYKDFVEFLLGISTDASKITDRWPVLALVAADRHRGVAELLGSEEIDLDAEGDNYNTTLLMVAARRGHGDLVELLLNAGAEINAKGHFGSTALMIAAEHGRKDMVELLLNAGADVHAKTEYGSTALTKAVEHDQEEIVELLLDRGADIHGKSKTGSTLLMLAIYRDVKFMVELLLKKGADVHEKDKDGSTALIVAAHLDRRDITGLLLDRGADVNARDKYGSTALIVAARLGHKKLAELLLDRGADIHAKDEPGKTALILAARWNLRETLKLLLDRGADVHAKDRDGSTALIIAARRGKKGVVKLLLSAGADVQAKNNKGSTALMVAEEKGYTNTADLLRTHMSLL